MSDDLVFEALYRPLFLGGYYLGLLGRRLDAPLLVKAWLAALREAGFKAEQAKEWSRGGKWPKPIPFVIEFDCPFGHRTEDDRRLASVRLIVLDDGWVKLDPDSPCQKCNRDVIAKWLVDCPRCAVGDDSPLHPIPHGLWHMHGRVPTGEVGLVGSTAPFSFLLEELTRIWEVAEAEWWVNHTEDARVELRRMNARHNAADAAELADVEGWCPRWPTEGEPFEQEVAQRVANGRRVLQTLIITPPKALSAPREEWSDERAAAWLDQRGVPVEYTQRGAWSMVSAVEGRPPKNVVERAQTLRKKPGLSS